MTTDDRTRALGARLRSIRNQQGLSLAQVEARSGGVWKAVVVGAYERGDRAVSLQRLADLASFYGVPLADLLPRDTSDDDRTADARRAGGDPDRITLDLPRLDPRDPRLAPVARFASYVRRRRGDHNGRMLTLRGGDLDTIAFAMGREPDLLLIDLQQAGVVRRGATTSDTGSSAGAAAGVARRTDAGRD
jgi:transcriptional regulator with XRE-family HTH domain